MKLTAPSRPAVAAFTLIELLTVIVIIAILMGLLFPAVNAVKEAGRKADAKNSCTGIVAAVKQYYTEYGKYPPIKVEDSGGGGQQSDSQDIVIGDPDCPKVKGDNKLLFNTLRALSLGANRDHVLNPRRIIFFEGKAVTDVKSPRSGFVEKTDSDNQGNYYDPWGKQYNVIIDSNYDTMIDVDQVYQDADWQGDGRPHIGVGAFSMGKDNKVGDKKQGLDNKYREGQKISDDVVSWQ
jgi:prepilin-type N-terminal cleavage/methylation domain-containing protein